MARRLSTDPYGKLGYAVGSADDFWCFDFDHDRQGNRVRLHAVINSETGSFIQDAEAPVVVPVSEAVDVAKRMVAAALEWCSDNDVRHDHSGWNQDPTFFARDVQAAVTHGKRVTRILRPVRRRWDWLYCNDEQHRSRR